MTFWVIVAASALGASFGAIVRSVIDHALWKRRRRIKAENRTGI